MTLGQFLGDDVEVAPPSRKFRAAFTVVREPVSLG